MGLLVPSRIESEEILDHGGVPWDERTRSLRDLRAINRFAGGTRVFRRMLERLAPQAKTLSILDLGTGTSDLLADVARTRTIEAVGLDLTMEHLVYGRSIEPSEAVRRIRGDAMTIPLADESVDVVTSSHFMHHFDIESNRAILAEALRVARIGVAFTDTRRHRVPLLFVQLLGLGGVVGRVTRHDAPASVRQGYTTSEIERLAHGFGSSAEVVRYLPWRFVLIVRK